MANLRVLIIDDDVDFADGLADFVELLGHETETANSAKDGVGKAMATRFDVVLVDVGLPGRSGVECVRDLRDLRPKMKCVLMTGYSIDWLEKTEANKVDVPILTKPITLDQISALLSG